MLRAALDAEERARLEQRIAERADMTNEARAEERETIEQYMGACPGLVPDEDEQEALIDLGYVPIIDPFTQHDGIEPSDIVSVHGLCMSRTALLLYLDRSRDEFGHPPAMPDGLHITQADMHAMGLNPMEYGFFNEALPRVYQVPPIQAIDLAALGLDADEVLAIQNAMDEVAQGQNYAAGTFPSNTTAEDFYLAELSRDALSLEHFIELLERPYTLVFANGSQRVERFEAGNSTLIVNMAQSYVSRYDVPGAPSERAPISYHLLMAKIDYLLTAWRGNYDNRYNIYARNNAELRAVLRMRLSAIASAFESHAIDTLMIPFVNLGGNDFSVALINALVIARPNESRDEITERVNNVSIVQRGSPEIPRLARALFTRYMTRGYEISQTLAAGDIGAFRRAFSEFNERRISTFQRFRVDVVRPWHVALDWRMISHYYNPVLHDLMRYIVRNAEQISTFVTLYRSSSGDNAGRRAVPLDIGQDDWRMITLVLCYPDSLFALLRANYANESIRANRMTPLAQRMSRETKEFFIAGVDNAQSIARMRFYFGMAGVGTREPGAPRQVIDISEEP